MAKNTPAQQLFDMLVSKNLDPDLLDSSGKSASVPADTEVFSFDFVTESGNNYGTVVIMLDEENNLEVYFGDNVGKTMETSDKNEWYSFLEQLKHFSTKNLLNFGLKNINRLRYSMQGQAAIKEGLFESWSGNKHTSWNDKPEHVRLMIKHKKPIGENDARYRYIESLFLETSDGERFKLPFTKLAGGRAMCEHVRAGGKPYDARGQHIASIVEEINVLSRFRRANHGRIFEGDTAELVFETNQYYENLNRVLKGLGSHRGYSNYFESWNPAEITEQDIVVESIKSMFVRHDLDRRIEEALPILARIQQQGQVMKEANIFESWANRLMEGTWATPETPEQKEQLITLLSKELPVGADATNATEQLYDLLGDDQLFDQLETLADQDANADARQTVLDRMQELSNDPDIAEVIGQLNVDIDTPTEPEAALDAEVTADETGVEQDIEEAGDVMFKHHNELDRLERLRSLAKRMGNEEQFARLDAQVKKIYADNPVGMKEEGTFRDEDGGADEDDTLDEAIGSFFVVYDDGRKPFGPMSEEQARATVAKYREGQVIPATKLAHWQQSNRQDAMASEPVQKPSRDPWDYVKEEDGECNHTSEGVECPAHGLAECGSLMPAPVAEGTSLQGQYGHSGKLKAVDDNSDFLGRLKELSGLVK